VRRGEEARPVFLLIQPYARNFGGKGLNRIDVMLFIIECARILTSLCQEYGRSETLSGRKDMEKVALKHA
jgi:hypothetical protein